MTKRPFADVAIAFANGEVIQYKANHRPAEWLDWPHPWFPSFTPSAVGIHDYRIKPQKVWKWVVQHDGVLAVSEGHFSSAKAVETLHPGITALQPVLSTEKEL